MIVLGITITEIRAKCRKLKLEKDIRTNCNRLSATYIGYWK